MFSAAPLCLLPPHPSLLPLFRYTIYKYDKATHSATVGIATPRAATLTPTGRETSVRPATPETATQAAEDEAPATTTSTTDGERGIRIGPITLTPRGVRVGAPSAMGGTSTAKAAPAAAEGTTRTSMADAAVAPRPVEGAD